MTLSIWEMAEKWFVRTFAASAGYWSRADAAVLEVEENESIAIVAAFRTWQKDGAGASWRTLLQKTGVGDDNGGADIGYKLEVDCTNTGGEIKMSLGFDDPGVHGTLECITTGGQGYNDGTVWVVAAVYHRAGATAGNWYMYVGRPGYVALNNSGVHAANLGDTLENNGVEYVSSAGTPWIGDIFGLRLFINLELTSAMVLAICNGDLTRPIDTHGLAGLEYTADPTVTGGCVQELCKYNPSVTANRIYLEDTSGNDLDMTSQSANDLRYCWDRYPLPVAVIDLASDGWSITDQTVKRAWASGPVGLWTGGRGIDLGKLRERNITVYGRLLEASRAAREAARSALLDIARRQHLALVDSGKCAAPYGFIIADGVNEISEEILTHLVDTPYQILPLPFRCSDPYFRLGYQHSDEVALNVGNGYTDVLDLSVAGNAITYPVIYLLSTAAAQGYVTIENLRTGQLCSVGEINQTDIWSSGADDDTGKTIIVDCWRGAVWWCDGDITTKMPWFLPEFLRLEPGVNRLRFTLTALAGPIGPGNLTAVVDYWELQI